MEFKKKSDSVKKDTLYVEVNRNDGIPLTTRSVIFLYRFCDMNNYNVIKVYNEDKYSQTDGSTERKGRYRGKRFFMQA